jgi:hypothetical protein
LAGAGVPEWRVGLSHVKVTPEWPMPMAGYAGRTKPFAKVTADLYVKVLVLEDAKGQRGAIVTSDLIGFTAAILDPIWGRIEKQTGLKREQVLVNSSHTHAGPLLGLQVTAKDVPGEGEAQRVIAYTRQLQDKVVQAVAQASAKLEPAQLSWNTGVAEFVMNRREFTPTGVKLGANPRGLCDRSVPALRIDAADGKPRAVLFGAATHGTTLGADNFEVCGDFAGFAQQYFEERHPGLQAMFMIGCAGDSNTYPRGTMELTRRHGKTLADEVGRLLDAKRRPVKGPLRIAFERTDLPLQNLTRDEVRKLVDVKKSAQRGMAEQMLAVLERGEKLPTHYTAPITVWQFGQDLTLVGLPGEVVVDYVADLEKAIGPNQLWIAAYCNDVFGYLPSARVLAEGGYETRGLYTGSVGFFAPSAEAVVVRKVRELAGKAGRPLPD